MIGCGLEAYTESMNKHMSNQELITLQGKRALITGAAMGIGEAIAERYAEAGACLQLIDIEVEKLEKVATRLREQYGTEVDTFCVDLAKRQEIEQFWRAVPVIPNILVNNAGVYQGRTFHSADQDFVDHMMQVNLGAVMQMCHAFIEKRRKKGGVIVNVSSIEAKSAFKSDMAIYAASKSAVLTLTKSLAREYAHEGFKVNVIVPGGVRTPGTAAVARNELRHFHLGIIGVGIRFAQRVPLGHFATPDDIARIALVLATPLSDYLSGTEIVADGGFLVA